MGEKAHSMIGAYVMHQLPREHWLRRLFYPQPHVEIISMLMITSVPILPSLSNHLKESHTGP